MTLVKKINPVKKKIFKKLTNSFINSSNLEKLKYIHKNAIIRILITRPNHRLGNQLLITPLIQEIESEFPNCKIDLAVNGTLSNQLFTQFNCVDKIIQFPKKPFKHIFNYLLACSQILKKKYDIVIVGNETSSSSKIFAKLSRGRFKIFNSENTDNFDKPQHIAKYPIYTFKKALDKNENLKYYNYSPLSIRITEEEKEKGAEVINKLFNNNKTLICIFTFATGNKCYSKNWWHEFYQELKIKFPNSNILEILPIENVSQIDFESIHFYSKDLREIASVMEKSNVFIGADSGMMHLSAATNNTTIGLFKTTNLNVYSPYGGENFSINTTKTNKSKIIEMISKITFYNKV